MATKTKTKTKFKREVEIIAAFDKRAKDPSKNYGIHGAEMRFVLIGKKGAVQFVLYTNWQLPSVYKSTSFPNQLMKPLPADLGYHSLKPIHESQGSEGPSQEKCPYLDGKPCYYDGSGLNAVEIFDAMVSKGGEAMWKHLEDYYESVFESCDPE